MGKRRVMYPAGILTRMHTYCPQLQLKGVADNIAGDGEGFHQLPLRGAWLRELRVTGIPAARAVTDIIVQGLPVPTALRPKSTCASEDVVCGARERRIQGFEANVCEGDSCTSGSLGRNARTHHKN